ncbi:MAG: hypothetical protein IKW98_09770 [Prevotella sp.]|nr:hypothetical protein [Prevotella sp.]
MKKIALILTAVIALFSTVGCKNGANGNATNSPDNNAGNASTEQVQDTQVQDTMVLGKLYFVNLKEGEKPVMTALSLSGNRSGSTEFNSQPAATEGIRSVFELSEWVEFYPEASANTGIKVMVFKHNADQGFYLNNTLNEETPGYVQQLDLNKDPDAEENAHWGSFYLHHEEVEPGLYDFVFIYDNKVFATMLTKFYKNDELSGKSDSDLEKLMTR